ncbi:hypothetical protein LXA43DRAFT_1101107 [Ganoderma leucocontextum]|nr:hypothetical protein LXA43DRAFT_1101107 [Ganoderma leucocontextum]
MTLESGKYTILSKVDGAPVGRRLAEDRSLLPKGIYKLPKDLEVDVVIWDVEKLENGNYKFKAIGDVVGAIDGRLFAILLEDQVVDAATEWTLQQDERDAAGNAYVVMTAGQQGDGWVAPTGEDEQILIKPIIAGFSLPPAYPPTEVFVFNKLD